MIYDGIVVGAGPAGAVLAYLLADRGLRVLMLERARFPRYKPCGGGVTLKAVQELPFDASPALEVQAEAGRLSFRGRPVVRASLDRPTAWLVMRERFDQYLVEHAQEAGAGLMQGVAILDVEEGQSHVVVRSREGRTFAARFLAGADGVHSAVARAMGLLPHRRLGTALQAELAVSDAAHIAQGAEATFDFGVVPRGYGWIFPKRDCLSIGVFAAHEGPASGLRSYLRRFVAADPALQDAHWLSVRGHRIPLGRRGEVLHRGRTLLVGDAANLADPWLGEGIYYAIASARRAADAIYEALSAGDVDLSGYTERVNTEIASDFAYARCLGWLVYRLPRIFSLWLSRSPVLPDAVFKVVRGDITFRRLFYRLLRQIPRIVVEASLVRPGVGWEVQTS